MIVGKGKLLWDPVAYATGRRRIAKLRPLWTSTLYALLSSQSLSPSKMTQLFEMKEQYTKYNWAVNQIPADSVIKLFALLKEAPLSMLQQSVQDSLKVTRIDPFWAIVPIPLAEIESARSSIFQTHGKKTAVPYWGPHISVVRGEKPLNTNLWNEQKEISFQYDSKIKNTKRNYFYFDIVSPDLEQLRKRLGLSPKPSPPFHITIGCLR